MILNRNAVLADGAAIFLATHAGPSVRSLPLRDIDVEVLPWF
jgi:hypothetical protein